MQYLGEIISLLVAVSWTAGAIFADVASHRIGSVNLNIIRMAFAILFLAAILFVFTGSPLPLYTDGKTLFWFALSGIVGFVFGDFCLFNAYVRIGSLYGQLLMTLAPPIAGIAGFMMLGEKLAPTSLLAMTVTLSGIGITILSKDSDSRLPVLKLPLSGVLYGIGAGLGQGVGLVLSKIGMEHYTASMPSDAASGLLSAMPFAGTFIRVVTGIIGFSLIIMLKKESRSLQNALKDRTAMVCCLITTLLGPVIGVSLSLMAVQHTSAGIASTLMGLTPVMILIPYSVYAKQRITLKEVAGTFITVAGVALFFLL
ncbi:MAG: DMT family transporter [Bacteroidales bacterium]|nr:DMT family transporter [Candidatus Cacconaster scatequi]